MCIGGTIDLTGTQHVVHNLQPVGAAIVDRQTRSAIAENDQAAVELRPMLRQIYLWRIVLDLDEN